MFLQPGDRFLLIGDSITDAGRREDPEGIGFGYVRLLRDMLWARHPALDVTLANRGIGGDTVRLMSWRWRKDVLAENPTVLSVSIGVNDVWRQLQDPANEEEVLLDEFEETYRKLLDMAAEALHCRLILCEATVIDEHRTSPHNLIVDQYNGVIAKLARDFNALLVPMNQAFWRAIEGNPSRRWTEDGVHPLTNGHMLMAITMYEALGGCEK
ncbi:MAG: SGNH/GDSL hydrolase family protein [Candidatus Hydrogenedentes bacterium]|nr:SGNH/GDSL hydrolase family protein [Candidatus Hydrogenedentota bacterium]